MKQNLPNPTRTLILTASAACLAGLAVQAAPGPYDVDADTLHLWHFDEVQNTNTTLPAFVVQDVSAQSFYDLDVVNGAKLEAPSFSVALNGALDNRGIPGALQYGAGALSEEELFFYPDDFAGAGGEFTFEALVKPDFDPSTPDVPRPPMQILSLENDGDPTTNRVFQFRLNSTSTNDHWALEFINIGSAAAASNVPVTVTMIDDFNGTLSNFTDRVILDAGGTTSNTYAWEIVGGTLQITTTTYDGIEQYALVTNLALPVGQQLVCDYDHLNLGSQDIGLFVGDGIPSGIPAARSNFVTVYVRNSAGEVFTRGFDGGTEYGLVGGGNHPNLDYLFIARIATNVFQTGYYEAGNRVILATRTNTVGGVGTSVGIYADVRAVGTRGNVDNLRFATNLLAVPPAEPETFSVLLPTNGVNAAVQGNWYHVAVAYNGTQNTANNLTFYWTALTGSPASASPLASFQMTNDLGSAFPGTIEADFAIGNEGRGGPGESFDGFIDEVRVSAVARAAGAFNLNGTPYTAEANTRLLYHLDESNPADFPTSLLNDAFDEVVLDPVALHVRNGASFGATAYAAAFGTALLVNGSTNDAAGAYADAALPITRFTDSTTGAFTFEALVRPDFDPGDTNDHMQIISMEGDDGTRPFQWKFLQRTTNTVPLEIQFININNGPEFVSAPVPVAGAHAIVQGNWYHAAITYNGDTNDANNLKFYWTALNSGDTIANLILSSNLTADIVGTAGDFAVGNEDRSTGGSTDGLVGVIDEVRVSSVARAADQFLVSVPRPEITSISVNQGAGQVTLIWTSQVGRNYTISRSTNLAAAGGGFSAVATGIAGTAPTTTNTVSTSGGHVELYRVEVE